MKIPNREINIFNLSMLDIICGALGAFLIVTIILIPSYQNQAKIKVAEVNEKKKQNRRMEEKLGKLKARSREQERLRKVSDANEEMKRKLAARRQELARLRHHREDLGPSPPMYVFVYWWWENDTPENNALVKIDLKIKARPEGQVMIAPTEHPAPAFDPVPDGEPSTRIGRAGTFFVIRNPAAFKEFDISYAASPRAPAKLFVGAYVQYGNEAISLGEVFRESAASKDTWEHFHGTVKVGLRPGEREQESGQRVSGKRKSTRSLSFELSEEGRKYDKAAREWHAKSREQYAREGQRVRDERIRQLEQRVDKAQRRRGQGKRSKSRATSAGPE